MKATANRVLVLGAGQVGAWVARGLVERGCQVTATTTNPTTARALTCLGVDVLPWRWEEKRAWDELLACKAQVWCVTVPPRQGAERVKLFHQALQSAAKQAGVRRLIWTSSTAVYDPNQEGDIVEADAGHHLSRHTGVDLLGLENLHRQDAAGPCFVAMRFGGLFSEHRHPVSALLRRMPIEAADGHVQWVHERDAANACVLACLHEGDLPAALNVVAPEVATRREWMQAAFREEDLPPLGSGGCQRHVRSDALTRLGMQWQVPDPISWVVRQAGIEEDGVWSGPHGAIHWSRHKPRGREVAGRVLMVHGYKGFRRWGNWGGIAEAWSQMGWEVIRMDFSHNGHLPPFVEDCLDEEAWSANRYHMEVDEVAFGLDQLQDHRHPLVLMGHSRGGAMAVLGARAFEARGGKLLGVTLWAPVSDVFSRFPQGADLESWRESNRLEVVNGRTGQVLVHPFAFYEDAVRFCDSLDVRVAAESLACPVHVVHGESDAAVAWMEGRRISRWAKQGAWALIEGADHVFGMRHPCHDAHDWSPHLSMAWNAVSNWLASLQPES